ncbi:hypothetical protein [Tumebacillus avium]|nr:hypothetical protein [Tumebacillus avium]
MKRLVLFALVLGCFITGSVVTADVKNSAETLPGPGPMVSVHETL